MSAPAIEGRGITKTLGIGERAVTAVGGVDLAVAEGTLTALVGPSGSGKTTLLNCLCGLDRPDAGTVVVLGTEVTALSAEQAVDWRRTTTGLVFQQHGLVSYLTAAENVDAMLRLIGQGRDDRAAATVAALELLQVAEHATKYPGELSGGQRQRVALARAIAHGPPVLIADEPTGELDSATTHVVLDALAALVADGMTILTTTHDGLVEARADAVIRLESGRVISHESIGESP